MQEDGLRHDTPETVPGVIDASKPGVIVTSRSPVHSPEGQVKEAGKEYILSKLRLLVSENSVAHLLGYVPTFDRNNSLSETLLMGLLA